MVAAHIENTKKENKSLLEYYFSILSQLNLEILHYFALFYIGIRSLIRSHINSPMITEFDYNLIKN